MNVLEVQGLTKRYPAFTLNGVSFDVPQGAVMGFIGRNGAGKSTTLKSILGMVHPDAGAVRVFGMDYAENERAIRRELGVVLGEIDFYPKKKIKTITDVTRRFYNNWDEEKYRHYLELFHIDESKRVDQLSSGMKVKYMIALALSHNARLLILDEPTSGLEPRRADGAAAPGGGGWYAQRAVLYSHHLRSGEVCHPHCLYQGRRAAVYRIAGGFPRPLQGRGRYAGGHHRTRREEAAG